MARLRATIAESSGDLEIVGKKAQKRQAKAAARAAKVAEKAKVPARTTESAPPADDSMSRCALLCQEQRWREAALLCREERQKALSEGGSDATFVLGGAMRKIEYSLRRQMASAFIVASSAFLKKEYLLDVGE